MAEFIPKRIEESDEEDIQDVESDPVVLGGKYIVPIDRIRSIAKPGNGDDSISHDGSRKLESRAHAFFRFIGFPVVAGKNSTNFYNPGFDPTGPFMSNISGQGLLRTNVIASFTSDAALKKMVEKREQDPQDARNVFVRRDTSSSIYAILLQHIRNFNMLKPGVGAFDEMSQTVENKDREKEVAKFFSDNPNIDLSFILQMFKGISHTLHPFIVDPRIDNTVMPDSSQIAVPFLQNKTALKLDNNVFALRPGIELIIRERLRDANNEASNFLQNAEKLLNNSKSPSDASVRTENELRLTVEALLDNNSISQSAINSDIKGITNVQLRNIRNLVKTIRAVINHLHFSMLALTEAREEINWVPIPSQEGPERGAQDAMLNQDDIAQASEIDRQILALKVKKLNMDRKISAELDLGNFASPFESNVSDGRVNDIELTMKTLVSMRDSIASKAFKAMGDMEIISGEISGLGLLDILAIYTALWAMEEKALISMLDDQSFKRMVDFFGADLLNGTAKARHVSNDKYEIGIALEKFEKKLINVFAFIDREIQRQNRAPGEEVGGTVSADS